MNDVPVDTVLSVRDLVVEFATPDGPLRAVDGVSFDVAAGRTLAIVGESGCGKTVTALALLGMVPPPGRVVAGSVTLAGKTLTGLDARELRRVRGRDIAMVFQDPMTSLNPVLTVGEQIREAVEAHESGVTTSGANARMRELLALVGMPDPAGYARRYPHQLSGGMRQRAMIAMAIANRPRVLVADEPTTALDVTVQAQVLDVLRAAQRETGAATILITHDRGVVAEMADHVAVMRAGKIVESAPVEAVFHRPRRPYTAELLAGLPSKDRPGEASGSHATQSGSAPLDPAEVLRAEGLTRHYSLPGRARSQRRGLARAVDGVDLVLHAGETLGLVGESGCGKSTLARLLVRLDEPTTGRIVVDGQDVTDWRGRRLRQLRRDIQIVFQDPYASLDPRMTVGAIVGEPLRIHGLWRDGGPGRVAELLELVGLRPQHAHRFPHEFSGGQRQRIGIARALALQPKVLVLDEPVSALDVSIRAQILDLLSDLRQRLDLACLFIAHDLALVRHVADRVAIMYLGRIVETGPADVITTQPTHPYTQALLSAVPVADPSLRGLRERIVLRGEVPSPTDPPSGCVFRTRCWKAQGRCAAEVPALADRFGHGHPAACHYAERPSASL